MGTGSLVKRLTGVGILIHDNRSEKKNQEMANFKRNEVILDAGGEAGI